MSTLERRITFVTWPNGNVDEKSLTNAGETTSKRKMLEQWLIPEFFGTEIPQLVVDSLWRNMERQGFRIHTITLHDNKEVTIR